MDAAPREVKVHIVPSSDWNRRLVTSGSQACRACRPTCANAIFPQPEAYPQVADPRPGRRLAKHPIARPGGNLTGSTFFRLSCWKAAPPPA